MALLRLAIRGRSEGMRMHLRAEVNEDRFARHIGLQLPGDAILIGAVDGRLVRTTKRYLTLAARVVRVGEIARQTHTPRAARVLLGVRVLLEQALVFATFGERGSSGANEGGDGSHDCPATRSRCGRANLERRRAAESDGHEECPHIWIESGLTKTSGNGQVSRTTWHHSCVKSEI